MTGFSDRPWAARFSDMGDASEEQFVLHVDGKCERWGINRPEGVNVPSLPARVRAAPDYLTNQGFVECMGLGRGQKLQIKLEKWGVLRYWNDLMHVRVFVWDSHKKRKCLIGLDALDKLVQTPDLCTFAYFDDRKLVFAIPADAIFEAADGVRRYMVVTPAYTAYMGEYEPPEEAADVYEVEANSKRDAISFAVRYWLSSKCPWREGQWVKDCKADGVSPYRGPFEVIDLTDVPRG